VAHRHQKPELAAREAGGAASESRSTRNSARWRTVARVRKPQGRRGEVAVELLTDFPTRLAARHEVWLWDGTHEPEVARIERAWFHKNFLVFKFAGVDSIAAARQLAGHEIQIPATESPELPATTYYVSDLLGCRVVDLKSGAELGRVQELIPTGGTDLLAVRDSSGREILIPFAQEICRRIAPEEKLIEVALPDGLAELNQ